jgi:hypothetical protein
MDWMGKGVVAGWQHGGEKGKGEGPIKALQARNKACKTSEVVLTKDKGTVPHYRVGPVIGELAQQQILIAPGADATANATNLRREGVSHTKPHAGTVTATIP